ncbi:putative leucine-rich repeat-containing protein DDB_G0290503 [Rhopalosiphum maidis]|uniref:putative leucine-rich repeat-containing protein DDB_G0290503 n=1 Tax=Rhopalosiphum maidis TaxID=43146 RepID=UPI000F00FDDE|nr:putative leucine-rich repeat-containing protein DDB_G0290503 [Rhopalosiphum maidis]
MDNCIGEECKHNSNYMIDNCTIFNKKTNLKTENQNLKNDEQVLGNGNHFIDEILMRNNHEKNDLDKINLLSSLLSEKNNEVIERPSYCSNSCIAKCSYENKPLPDCINKNNISCKAQQLLCEIEEFCSKEPCNPNNKLLKQSRITICSLIEEMEIHSSALKYNQEKFECCFKSLNEERKMSKNKDSELCRMKTDLSILADKLKEIIKHNNFLSCNIDKVSKDLLSKIIEYKELLKKSDELKEQLNNVEYCLNLRIDESKCIKKELSKKCQIIEAGIIIKQEMEFKLSNLEKKLEKSKKLNNICNNKCNDLILLNLNLENNLQNEKNYNCKKAIYIDDLCKKIYDLETIIKGIEDHKLLYTEEISKLKTEKYEAELKLKEFNSMINTQKNKLAITISELAYTKESLKNKNDCQIQKIQQLEHNIKNYEKDIECYKVQHDILTNQCMMSNKDLSESQMIIKMLETKINEIDREYKMTLHDLTQECDHLKSENCKFLEKINELNENIICVNKEENHVRKDLAACNEKLLIANDEISHFDLEIKCINTKLEITTEKLTCTERELEEIKLKLNNETHLKDKINEKYCSIMYDYSCPQEKCLNVDNNRLSNPNLMSCKIARNANDGEQIIHLNLVDAGSQTHMCPIICQPITSTFHSITNNSNSCKSKQCDNCNSCISSCDSDKISNNPCQMDFKKNSLVSASDNCSCFGKSKVSTQCFGFLFDKENLQRQLNEMKLLLKKKEKAAKKELCDTEQIYYNKDMIINKCLDDTRKQYQQQLDDANAQLESYETAILYKEYELKNFQIREHQFKMEIEKLNETIQNKDKKIESEQKQVVSASNSKKDYEEPLLNHQKPLELEKLNKHSSAENFQLITDGNNNLNEMFSELDNKVEISQTLTKKKRISTRKNVNKSICALKKTKKTEKKKNKYGPKLNLPCCIGSKNPCNRQKILNLQRDGVVE